MQIKIGVVGTQNIIERLLRVLEAFPSLSPVIRVVTSEKEVPEAVGQLSGEIEALLLFGALSHRKAKEVIGLGVPVHYVPLTGTGLYRALFRALQNGHLDKGISVDTLTRTVVQRAMDDLGISDTNVLIYEGPPHASPDKLIKFHSECWSTGQATFAITGLEAVADKLSQAGLDNEWLIPSEQDMTVTLERVLLSTDSRRSKESQIVVGMLNVDQFGKLILKSGSEHEVQRLKLDIHRMLLEYVESLDGYLTSLGGDEYLFLTTRGIFERETGGYKTIPLAKDLHTSFGLSLSLGIGFGTSANEAGTHARIALRKCKEAGGNTCFIVREDDTLIGPLEMAQSVERVMPPTDAELINKAEVAGMTSAYLSRLLSQASRHGKTKYTVHELAACLDITVRSAHRLLLLWMDNGLVDIADVQKGPRGRPRQIFRFQFLEENRNI